MGKAGLHMRPSSSKIYRCSGRFHPLSSTPLCTVRGTLLHPHAKEREDVAIYIKETLSAAHAIPSIRKLGTTIERGWSARVSWDELTFTSGLSTLWNPTAVRKNARS